MDPTFLITDMISVHVTAATPALAKQAALDAAQANPGSTIYVFRAVAKVLADKPVVVRPPDTTPLP